MTYSTNFSIEDLRFDNYGLIPAIAQDWLDGSILMVAWMNKESLTMTLETKNVHYWSRSRSEIWRKGATSGSTQILKKIRFCLLYTSPSPRDKRQSRMPSSA